MARPEHVVHDPRERYRLYELCVQDPPRTVRFLEAVHAGRGARAPRVLREDFCGPGSLARAWAALGSGRRAVAVDREPEPPGGARGVPGVKVVMADVRVVRHRADVIAALNFAVCELHARADLMRYLRGARRALRPGGVLVCDLYGGREAYSAGSYRRRVRGPGGERVVYRWEQRAADPLTGRVENAIHFEVRGRGRAVRLPDAFVYHWRLWSLAELREAMLEAGFGGVLAYDRMGDALEESGRLHVRAIESGAELAEDYVVYLVARVGRARGRSGAGGGKKAAGPGVGRGPRLVGANA